MCIDVDMGVLRSRLPLERVSLTSLFQIAPPFGKRQGEILDVGGDASLLIKWEEGDYERGRGKGELARNVLASGIFQAYHS